MPSDSAQSPAERAFEAYRKREDPNGDWCDVEEENERFAFFAGRASAFDEVEAAMPTAALSRNLMSQSIEASECRGWNRCISEMSERLADLRGREKE